jgi:L-aspartate oxidase
MMGGIVADLDSASTVPGLYAVGEVSCTGLHGANRLASNSLSECFVFARRAVAAALSAPATAAAAARPSASEEEALAGVPAPADASRETRAALWREAGIFRTRENLERLAGDPHPLARLIARCALARTESRGAHLRADHPQTDPAFDARHAVISGDDELDWQTWR